MISHMIMILIKKKIAHMEGHKSIQMWNRTKVCNGFKWIQQNLEEEIDESSQWDWWENHHTVRQNMIWRDMAGSRATTCKSSLFFHNFQLFWNCVPHRKYSYVNDQVVHLSTNIKLYKLQITKKLKSIIFKYILLYIKDIFDKKS